MARARTKSNFRRLRRGMGHHHHIAGPYLVRFTQEAAWREDNRHVPNGELLPARGKSVDFAGYWRWRLKAD
jgi:hypothetical protein